MVSDFHVKTDIFSGPLDLLLDLVEKRKLLINDISLSSVADDYLRHIKGLSEFPTADAAGFLLVASTLVLIKSKSLLPALNLTEEEEGSIEELEKRLKIYKRMKELSVNIKNSFGKNIIFQSARSVPVQPVFSPHKEITTQKIMNSIKNILTNLPKNIKLPEAIVRKVISIDEMIDRLIDRVQNTISISFNEFAGENGGDSKEKKLNLIVGFLALLELVKQETISVTQDKIFEDIKMEKIKTAQT